MNNIIAFVLVIFLFVSGFMIIGVNICDNVNRRIDKQNLNLAGRAVTEYAGYDREGNIFVDEKSYVSDLREILPDLVVGCIFVYDNCIKGFDCNGVCVAEIPIEGVGEAGVISAVNNVLYEIIPPESELEGINIACSDDYIKSKLFNSLNGVSVFSVTCMQRNGNYTYNVVGYCFFSPINI